MDTITAQFVEVFQSLALLSLVFLLTLLAHEFHEDKRARKPEGRMTETNLLTEAVEAARTCRDIRKKAVLLKQTSRLRDVLGQFVLSCSREDMAELVAAWTHVLLCINDLPVDKVVPLHNEKLTDAT